MKLNLLVVVVLFAALPVLGQTAKVIPLTQKDATEAKSLYAQQKDIEGKIADLRYRITKDYLTASKEEEGHTSTYSDPQGGGRVWVRNGWGDGHFDFSEDFKFIVPQEPPKYNSNPWNNCITLTGSGR